MLNKQELSRLHRLVDAHNPHLDAVFGAIAEPNRCKMLRLLLTQERAQLCVSDFAQILRITPAAASQHLKQLELVGLINKFRRGQKVCFQARSHDPLVTALQKAIIN